MDRYWLRGGIVRDLGLVVENLHQDARRLQTIIETLTSEA
jgi:hypothetical protein